MVILIFSGTMGFSRACFFFMMIVMVTMLSQLSNSMSLRSFTVAQYVKQQQTKFKSPNPMKNSIYNNLQSNFNLFRDGFLDLIPHLQHYFKIYMKSRKSMETLTYEELKILQRGGNDVSCTMNKVMFIFLAKEWFLYNILGTLIGNAENIWNFNGYPSTFETHLMKEKREKTLIQRKTQTLISALHYLLTQTNEDQFLPPTVTYKQRIEEIIIAFKKNKYSMNDALMSLESWYTSQQSISSSSSSSSNLNTKNNKNIKNNNNNNNSKKSTSTTPKTTFHAVKDVPRKIIKELVDAYGESAVWTLPLLNRMNVGKLQQMMEKIRIIDEYLYRHGLQELNQQQVIIK
jgi:hypothetical protein